MATTKPPSCFINHAFAESESLSDDDNEKPLSNIVHNPLLNREIVPFIKATAAIVHQRKEHNVRSEETNSGEELDDRVNGEELESKVEALNPNGNGENRLSSVQMEDLIGMMRNHEKNIFLLNDAKFRALEDLDIILSEKQSLQREINGLQTRLVENDARLKIAAQEKVHVDLLENQLQKLRNEKTHMSPIVGDVLHHLQNPNTEADMVLNSIVESLSEEMESLRTENMFLKQDLEALKAQFGAVKDTDQRVATLEEERSIVVSSLKDLESRVSTSQEDVSKLSSLRVEYKDLSERVECLQTLLDKATRKADQAILVSQQNQELLNKVDKLEESLEEANIYKLSSEKLQQYNELMQQKIKLLEDHLQRYDEEINSYVQLYQESVQEFQDTLNNLIEESKKRVLDKPVDDMPWELWSCLLLKVDGWLLEKKITIDDAKLLRDLVWKRDRKICDAYMECREKDEFDSISTFLKLTSAPKSPGLHVIHIAVEMALVAMVGGLGDVVSGLGKALQKRGHLVEIIIPKYDCLPVYFIEPLHPGKLFWRGQAPLYWDIYVPKGLNSARICFTCHNFEYQGIAHASELASCGLDVQQLNRPDRMQDNSAHDRVNFVKGAVVFSNIVTTVSPTFS
ncbi:Probable starch synthase 4, chloroplastic/amyloplastic [Linum perenne]